MGLGWGGYDMIGILILLAWGRYYVYYPIALRLMQPKNLNWRGRDSLRSDVRARCR